MELQGVRHEWAHMYLRLSGIWGFKALNPQLDSLEATQAFQVSGSHSPK